MLIAARESFAVARKRLPYDAEVEYLESTGTQYVDTGVMLTVSSISVSCDLDYNRIGTSGGVAIFGGRGSTSNPQNAWGVFGVQSSAPGTDVRNLLRFDYGSSRSQGQYNYTFGSPVTGRTSVTFGGYTLTKDGATYTASLSSQTPQPNCTCVLFGVNGPHGVSVNSTGTKRIFKASISVSGVLVRDYIPVRVGTVGEMYDKVTGTFATRVGTFTVGPDKTS